MGDTQVTRRGPADDFRPFHFSSDRKRPRPSGHLCPGLCSGAAGGVTVTSWQPAGDAAVANEPGFERSEQTGPG